MNRKLLMLTMVMSLLPAMAAGSSVYKWTDENGVTHFGDRQPTGQNSEQVDVRSGTSGSTTKERASPQEQVEELEQRQQEEQQRQKETAVQEARRKQREANCATARSNLEIIENNARIRTEENGEMRYLSPEEIEERRQQFQKIAEDNCGPAEEGQ